MFKKESPRFRFTNQPPRFSGFKKPLQPEAEPAPEPKPEETFEPHDVSGFSGDGLKLANIVNWTGKHTYNHDSVLWNPKNKGARHEIFALTQIAAEHMKGGEPAGRIIDRICQKIKAIDPNANI